MDFSFPSCFVKILCVICISSLFCPAISLAVPDVLTADQMASAAEPENLFIPTPGEIFAAIDKQCKANWISMNRDAISETSTRPQIALSLGALITDGYIAIEAQDSQGVKNIGKDILNLAKKLNVSQSLLARGSSLNEFAEKNQWTTLKEELEATQNEVKATMAEQKDQDLMILVTIGAWIRGLQATSAIVTNSYTPGAAKLLRQPAIVDYLLKKIAALPPKIQANPALVIIAAQLSKVQSLVNTSVEKPLSPETIKELHQIAAEMMNHILEQSPSPP